MTGIIEVTAAQVALSLFVAGASTVVQSELTKQAAKQRDAASEVSPAPPFVSPLSVTPEPGGPLAGVFGHRRVGGKVRLSAKSGLKSYLVIEVAGAPITSYAGVYINNVLVTLDASGYVTTAPWVDTSGNKAINVKLYDGTQTTTDTDLDAAFPGWTADHVGKGVSFVRIIMNPNINATYFGDVLSSTPDFTFDVLGFKCYDPRAGGHVLGTPSTYSYSDNVSICRANYLIHDLGMRKPASLVDWTAVAAAADIDDQAVTLAAGGTERRYTCSAYWTTDQRHEDVLSKFSAANGGSFAPLGAKWHSSSGAFGTVSAHPSGSTPTITPDDYEGDGIAFSDWASLGESVNGVRGLFTSPVHNYEKRDFPPYQDATALASDAAGLGVATAAAASWLDLDLDFVTSPSQAQRLARIAYKRARYGHPAKVSLAFTHFDTVAGDYVSITDDLAGFTAKTFRVVSESVAPDWSISMTLEHETAAFYDWTAATDEKAFEAEDPLLGDPGGLQPPGGAMVDTSATATIVPNVALWPSPSPGWDTYVVTRSGGADTLLASTATITAFVTAVNAVSVLNWGVYVKNSATGEVSPAVSFGSVTAGTLADKTEATTATYVLPAAKAPKLVSAHSGTARLEVAVIPASRSNQYTLWSATTNDTTAATQLSAGTNGASPTAVNVSGAAGTVRYYWVRAYNSTDNRYGPFSRATVVVF